MLYDVASALMYLGGRANAAAFWATYLDLSPASPAELLAHIDTFTRYRAAVQAAYFSMRIGHQNRTGISDDPDYQLSLAIGREGQNARLAAKLTGARIDIQPDSVLDE